VCVHCGRQVRHPPLEHQRPMHLTAPSTLLFSALNPVARSTLCALYPATAHPASCAQHPLRTVPCYRTPCSLRTAPSAHCTLLPHTQLLAHSTLSLRTAPWGAPTTGPTNPSWAPPLPTAPARPSRWARSCSLRAEGPACACMHAPRVRACQRVVPACCTHACTRQVPGASRVLCAAHACTLHRCLVQQHPPPPLYPSSASSLRAAPPPWATAPLPPRPLFHCQTLMSS